VEAIYAPSDNEVFQLVPADFAHHVALVYEDVGHPVVTDETFWEVYALMRGRFLELADAVQQEEFETALRDQHSRAFEIDIELLAQEGYQEPEQADFSDEDVDMDDWDGEDSEELGNAPQPEVADFTDVEGSDSEEGVGALEHEMADFTDLCS
jgi:hypothetical protein